MHFSFFNEIGDARLSVERADVGLDQPTEHLEELFWGAALLERTLATRFSAKNHELATI